MLSLSEVQQGHHSRFLVLWGVSLQDLINELVILRCELEWDVRIIFGGVAMLWKTVSMVRRCEEEWQDVPP
jgi:hypothetical protein